MRASSKLKVVFSRHSNDDAESGRPSEGGSEEGRSRGRSVGSIGEKSSPSCGEEVMTMQRTKSAGLSGRGAKMAAGPSMLTVRLQRDISSGSFGMSLNAWNRVTDIDAAGPASRAKLKIMDRILKVDGAGAHNSLVACAHYYPYWREISHSSHWQISMAHSQSLQRAKMPYSLWLSGLLTWHTMPSSSTRPRPTALGHMCSAMQFPAVEPYPVPRLRLRRMISSVVCLL